MRQGDAGPECRGKSPAKTRTQRGFSVPDFSTPRPTARQSIAPRTPAPASRTTLPKHPGRVHHCWPLLQPARLLERATHQVTLRFPRGQVGAGRAWRRDGGTGKRLPCTTVTGRPSRDLGAGRRPEQEERRGFHGSPLLPTSSQAGVGAREGGAWRGTALLCVAGPGGLVLLRLRDAWRPHPGSVDGRFIKDINLSDSTLVRERLSKLWDKHSA